MKQQRWEAKIWTIICFAVRSQNEVQGQRVILVNRDGLGGYALIQLQKGEL